MKLSEKIVITYGDHKLEQSLKKCFIHFLPKNFDWAVENDCNEDMKEFCNDLDHIEYHYRHHLVGLNYNLRKVNDGLRKLIKSKYFQPNFLKKMIKELEKDILHFELYELMPRHLQAKQKVLRFIKDISPRNNMIPSENGGIPPEDCTS